MDLKFRLQNGHIYDFEYSKYSDFIDNLEPEPGVIIDVLEPFTLEDFETAQIEYNKYVVYKEALEDIITKRKLWSKEELRELSKYDLDNPVLEWLMIKNTREEKKIKEKLSLESFQIKNLDSDNIILYYLINKTNEYKFSWACKKVHLEVAQWLYSLGDVNIHIQYEDAFRWACSNGHLEVAQWLYSLGEVNIHIMDEYAFKMACLNGHLEVAQWLYSLGGVNIHINNELAFRLACYMGHLEVAQWLYSIGDVNIHIKNEDAFRYTCYNGHLEVVQWIFSLGDVNIHIFNEEAFRTACEYGHLKVAQWLYSIGDVNIHILNEEAFRTACHKGHLKVSQWLWSLGGFHKKGIKTNHQPITDWLATLK